MERSSLLRFQVPHIIQSKAFSALFRLKMDQASVSLLISLLHELAEVSQTRFGKERYQRGMGYS